MNADKSTGENTPKSLLAINCDNGKIIIWNDKAAALTGYNDSELKEMYLNQLIGGLENLLIIKNQIPNAYKSKPVILRRKKGPSVYVKICENKIIDKLNSLLFISFENISKHNKTESETCQTCLELGSPGNPSADNNDITKKFPTIIGQSIQNQKICRLVDQISKTDTTVLLQGESGTGKEVVAGAIHNHSSRARYPFVKLNCATISETLMESELFGHVKGAFTGALYDYKGRFMQANNGTILLDEITSLSLASQPKLLRIIQQGQFEPVGSSVTKTVNVRIIVASNINLEKAIKKNEFREDLYYRLNVFPIHLPPLRDRKEDIIPLARHFLKKCNLQLGKQIRDFLPETFSMMITYDWPGNIRELEHAVEHAVILCNESFISPENLPSKIIKCVSKVNTYQDDFGLRDRLNLYEKQLIKDALAISKGIKCRAAKMLKVDPRNFNYLLHKHQL